MKWGPAAGRRPLPNLHVTKWGSSAFVGVRCPSRISSRGDSARVPFRRFPGVAVNCVTPFGYLCCMDNEQIIPIGRPKERSCLWCRTVFVLRSGPGRKKLYCKVSCRQRAFERRRGLGIFPPPEQLITRPGGPLSHLPNRYTRYEAGGMLVNIRRKVHALRPAGFAEPGERRATLCGLKKRPNTRLFNEGPVERPCQTCLKIAKLRPPARRPYPSSDLAAYRAQLDAVGMQLSRLRITDPRIRPDVSARLLFQLLAAA